jgi:hypothetical protein
MLLAVSNFTKNYLIIDFFSKQTKSFSLFENSGKKHI